MTLDGEPQAGGVLRVLLADGQELRAQSDARGRATLLLPRDRFARVFPSLPSLGLSEAQVELLEDDEAPELQALSAHTLLEVGSALGEIPPSPEEEGEERAESSLGFGPDEIQVPEDPGQSLLSVAFCSGAELRGRVLDASGHPAPGARVYLGPLSETPTGSKDTPVVRSDDEGRFLLRLGPRAALSVGEVLAESSQGSGTGEPQRSEVQGRVAFEPLTLRLRPGEALRGRVTDPEGRPLQAQVSASVGLLRDKTWTATCDGAGKFWFGGLVPRGQWLEAELTLRCPGYAPRVVEVSQPPEGPLLELRLTPLARCRGRVLGARGQPLPGARVITVFDPDQLARRYGPANGGPDLDALATSAPQTDAEGWFEFETPAGPRLLVVSAEGYGERVLMTSLQEDSLEVRLQPGGVIAGTVTTREGQPLDYRLLILVPKGYEPPRNQYEPGPAPLVRLTPGPSRTLPTAEVPTAVSSAVAREGRFRFENVPHGRYDIYARDIEWGSFVPRRVAVDVPSGELSARALFEPIPPARLRFTARLQGQLVSLGSVEFAVYAPTGELLTLARPQAGGEVELKLWTFGPLLLEGRGFGLRTIQRRLEVAPGSDQTLEPFDFDDQVGTVEVLLSGTAGFRGFELSGKDPQSGRWITASYSMGGDHRLLTFPPGPAEVRVRGFGRGEEVLKEVVHQVQVRLDAKAKLSIDLSAD